MDNQIPELSKDDFDYAVHLVKVVTKENMWYSIDEIMKWLYKHHLSDMRYAERVAKATRDNLKDDMGRAKGENLKTSNDMRTLGAVPPMITDIVEKFYGGTLGNSEAKKKFYRSFFKKYPQFLYTKKI